ncbi:MAG: hypothetical protein ACYSOI_07150, partial [Planctomycetota bacterium]
MGGFGGGGGGYGGGMPAAGATVAPSILDREIDFSSLTTDTAFEEAVDLIRNSATPPRNSATPPLPVVVLWSDLSENAFIEKDQPIGVDRLGVMKLGAGLRAITRSLWGIGITSVDFIVEDGVITIASKESLLTIRTSQARGVPSTMGGFGGGGGGFGGGGVPGGFSAAKPNKAINFPQNWDEILVEQYKKRGIEPDDYPPAVDEIDLSDPNTMVTALYNVADLINPPANFNTVDSFRGGGMGGGGLMGGAPSEYTGQI